MTIPRDIASTLLSAANTAHGRQDYDHCNTYAMLAQTYLLDSIDQHLANILYELQHGEQR